MRRQARHRRPNTGPDRRRTLTTAATTNYLDSLARRVPDTGRLQGRYYSRIHNLHGMCFYAGFCNDQTERRIRETTAYIDDAQALTGG